MNTVVAPDSPDVGWLAEKWTFGASDSIALRSAAPLASSSAPLTAVMAMGVSWRFSSRLRAVTTISSMASESRFTAGSAACAMVGTDTPTPPVRAMASARVSR